MTSLILDCTELYHHPYRTGIQRVVRELLKFWPTDGPRLIPAYFQPAVGLVAIPETVVSLLTEADADAVTMSTHELQQRIRILSSMQPLATVPVRAPVLIAEIFYDEMRCRFHEQRLAAYPGTLAMLAYDFLTYLRPTLFQFPSALPLMGYLRLIRMASSVGFISDQTRLDFANRIVRLPLEHRSIGPVLPLGADSLILEKQVWQSDRRDFVCVGSIDSRKHQDLVAEAFMGLWDQGGHPWRLVLIGRKILHRPLAWLEKAKTFPNFVWMESASDEDIADALRKARASIYLSDAEGFGLPPLESLNCGIPTIVLHALPSTAALPLQGQLRLNSPSSASVAEAVLAMANEEVAERLWTEAAQLELGTWHSFAQHVANWSSALE